LAKYTIALCGAGLLLGLLVERRSLRRAWPALAVALAIALPNLWWQASHGAPALSFAASSQRWIVQRFSRLDVLLLQPLMVHPLAFIVAMVGLRGSRLFAVLFLFSLALVVAVPGKPHHLFPAYLPLFAVGAQPVARWWAQRRRATRIALAAAAIASGVAGLFLTLPRSRANPETVQFADWNALAAQIPVGLPVLTDSYGTAAALELSGRPVWSGANGYYSRPPDREVDSLFVIGYPEPLLDELCVHRTAVGRVVHPDGLDNRYDFPRTIWLCRSRTSLRDFWPRLRRYD
jgi:hypothetical protein